MGLYQPWYVTSFQQDYLRIYAHRTDEAATEEVNEIIHLLNMEAGRTVLDLCCGNGRHSRALAKQGYKVTGIDLSETLIDVAQSKNLDQSIQYYQMDVREIPFHQEFDYVLNLFTSFGYFEEKEENEKVFQSIYRALKENGTFLIDFLNPGHIRKNLVSYSERVVEGISIIEKRRIEGNKVIKDIELYERDEKLNTYVEEVNLFEYDEMANMIQEAGLQVRHIYGDLRKAPYDPETSPRMIIIGKK